MREIPSAANLLHTAREILRTELVPALAPEQRHLALMIANAMAIARRQLDDGDGPERRELAALGALFDLPPAVDDDQFQAELVQRNRRLCDAIRAGRADRGTSLHAEARAALTAISRAKVMQSNPRYLERQS